MLIEDRIEAPPSEILQRTQEYTAAFVFHLLVSLSYSSGENAAFVRVENRGNIRCDVSVIDVGGDR
jgi:hypothetical protein